MKRKVNRVGQNTLTVSLPTKWAAKFGIKQGDEIEIDEDGTSLIISKELIKANKEIELRLAKESERYIRSYIGRLYRAGYSKITVFYEHPEVIVPIKKAINNLIGADIIDTEEKKCIIKIFPVEDIELDFDKNIIKMLITLKAMFDIVKKDIENSSFKSEETLDEFRHNNWKIKDFILRNASLQCVNYEVFSDLAHITFCYEKIGSKLIGFYKRYLMKRKKIMGMKKLFFAFDKIVYSADWLLTRASKKEQFSLQDETKFRHEVLDFNVYLFNELHSDKNIDHAVLTMVYLISELLDSTVSYLHSYKKEQTYK